MTAPTSDPGFATAASVAALSPAAHVAAMARVEAALAVGVARAGLADAAVALRVEAACREPLDAPDTLLAEGWEQGTPVLPLLDRLRTRLADDDDDALALLHRGATTQDVVDTAMLLQAREVLAGIEGDLVALVADLLDLAVDHRATPARAFTLLQPAVPTTVGRRAAGWLAPLVEHLRTLRALGAGLPLQLGGPTGTLPAYGADADDVVRAVATELGLGVPLLAWHADRGPVEVLLARLAGLARTVGGIATDLVLLAEHGTVRMRAGASSAMPDKRNPVDAVRARAAATACGAAASAVLAGPFHELERAAGAWHVEWWAVPQVLHTAAAAVEAIARALAGIEVVPEQLPGDEAAAAATPAALAAVDRVVAAAADVLAPRSLEPDSPRPDQERR